MQTFYFQEDGTYPNKLPVLYHPNAIHDTDTMQEVFRATNWKNSWVNGIFPYHHYHSTADEVLGVLSGYAAVQLGGPAGEQLQLARGDVLVLPAGTAHKRLQQTDDFEVIGAYPNGMSFNTKTDKQGEYEQALQDIHHVPLPQQDPVTGNSIWR
ncbi:Uncharacterized protein YjlB [Terribacillus aidingensis]|uniref:Uncharacterized protein YjlB n=1 Tax=Terribacillus aidingensis TaxID=586416 RepID=A0A285P4W5_9BACI|nr:cupin domain-containing protein [Terribacillus aidingensis]SNZ16764.1 Uncharacterized protein YjlB [Terribacillus aidingensis]